MARKSFYNTENFIGKAREIHGDKYDYSKTICNSCNDYVVIICPEHGAFVKKARFHLRGEGCQQCSLNNKKQKIFSAKDFIQEAKRIHGDKYDYSKVEYIDSATKVCIICPEHGEFWQVPPSHLRGNGCNKCSKPVYNTESFIEKARELHGDKYDYSKVEYKNSSTKVCIICPEHGEFWVTPNNHIRKKGCPSCAIINVHKIQKLSTESFIEKAREVHGDKYDYSKVEYGKNNMESVCIICPKHGEFWQKPVKHLSGHGCLKCKFSHLEREIVNLLDALKLKYFYQVNKTILPWLGRQTLDFYLPDYNIAIECQGAQHYHPVRWGGQNMPEQDALDNFKLVTHNDKRKKDKCLKNHCNLIYYTNEKFANNGEFYDINKLKVYLDGVVSIDDGTTLRKFMEENNIGEWKPEE